MSAEPTEIPGYIPGYIAGTWAIDPIHSDVGSAVRHLMISTAKGRVAAVEGRIVTAEGPLESEVSTTVGMFSVDTGSAQRDAHLRDADFFEVGK
jgi:polyisoprenoid-binding protein YceI